MSHLFSIIMIFTDASEQPQSPESPLLEDHIKQTSFP